MAEHEMKIRVMKNVSEGLGILGDASAVDAAVQRIKKEICK